MDLTGDRRGQSIQIGAIILFGALIILLSTYQAFVVPDQNREVEFKHSQAVQNDMKELRGGIISASDGQRSSVSVQLGTEYPARAIFLNPGPPSGSLRTVGTTDTSVNATIENATASGDAGDFWDGTAHNYSTGDLVYAPNYNEYRNAPETVYSNTLLSNRFESDNLAITDQSLVEGKTITLIALNGSLSRGQSGAVSVDVRPLSASSTTVPIENTTGENVRLELPTTLDNDTWGQVLDDEEYVDSYEVGSPGDGPLNQLNLTLKQGETYTLKLSRVGVGNRVGERPGSSYLVKTRGNGETVQEGEQVTLEVEARDGYNNPVTAATVRANTSDNNSDVTNVSETNSNGRATLTYEAPDAISRASETDHINVTLDGTPPAERTSFNESLSRNVTFSVTVQDSSSDGSVNPEYNISYNTTKINNSERAISCSAERCTYDFGKDKTDSAFTLITGTSPQVVGASVDFALNSTANGDYSREDNETANNGEARAVFDANNTGGVKSFVSSGLSEDTQVVELVDTSKLITAFESDTIDDSKYEFVQLYFAESQDTAGWNLSDDDGSGQITNLPDETLDGEVYFARNSSAFADKWNINDSRVYNLSTKLNDGGEPLWLNDSNGNVVDQVGYGGESPSSFDGSLSQPSEGDVADRTFLGSTYPYQDTNSTSDWASKTENAFFGNVAPTANFTYSPSNPVVGESIEFDASGSSDPNGDSLTYDWDWDNDGNYEDMGEQATNSFSSNSTVTLRVTDADGKNATTSQTVNVGSSTADESTTLVSSSKTSDTYGATFTLRNDGGSSITIQNITVDSTENNVATIQNGTKSGPGVNDDGPELFSNRTASLLDNEGFSIGDTVPLDQESTVSSGERTEYTLSEFRDNGRNEINPGSTVTITLGFSDGTEKVITLNF